MTSHDLPVEEIRRLLREDELVKKWCPECLGHKVVAEARCTRCNGEGCIVERRGKS